MSSSNCGSLSMKSPTVAEEDEYVIEVDSDLSPTGADIVREVEHEPPNVKVKLKRRRRCGICGPCQIKQNCGRCHYCLRRDVLKQTCVYRKCVYLRSKPRSVSPKDGVSVSALNLQAGMSVPSVGSPAELNVRSSVTPISNASQNDYQGLASMYHHPDIDSRAFSSRSGPSIPLHHDPVIPSRMNPYMTSSHSGPYPINVFPSSNLTATSGLSSPFQMGSCGNNPFRYSWMPGSFSRPPVMSNPTDLLRPSPSWPPPPGLSSPHSRIGSEHFGANSFQKDISFMKRPSPQGLLQNRQRLPSCSRALGPMSSGCDNPFSTDAAVMREKYGCFPGQGTHSLSCEGSSRMTSGTISSGCNRGCGMSQYESDVIGIDDFQVNAFIRASGTNGLEIEIDITSFSSLLPHFSNPEKMSKAEKPRVKKNTLEGTVLIRQDLGDEGIVELEVPGYKVTLEDIHVDEILANYSSSLKRHLNFIDQPKIEYLKA